MQRDTAEDVVEVSLQVRIQLRNCVAVLLPLLCPLVRGVIIHRAQQSHLLRGTRVDKIFSKELVALRVHAGQSVEEVLPLLRGGPLRQNHVNKFIHARRFGSRRVRLRNNQVRHHHHCAVLVRIQRAQLVSRPCLRLCFTKKSRQRRRKNRKHRSGSQHFQYVTTLHSSPPRTAFFPSAKTGPAYNTAVSACAAVEDTPSWLPGESIL